jgi:hypothetical protein
MGNYAIPRAAGRSLVQSHTFGHHCMPWYEDLALLRYALPSGLFQTQREDDGGWQVSSAGNEEGLVS